MWIRPASYSCGVCRWEGGMEAGIGDGLSVREKITPGTKQNKYYSNGTQER